MSAAFVVVALAHISAGNQSGYPPAPARKHVLAWADVRNGYQHDSISHALATAERLGWESGLYDPETWDNPMVRTMYFEAIKWALELVPGATAPIPKP